MTAYIQASGLVRIFRSSDIETFALQGLDLTVAHGEMVKLSKNVIFKKGEEKRDKEMSRDDKS